MPKSTNSSRHSRQQNNTIGDTKHYPRTRSKVIRDLIVEKYALYLKSPSEISKELLVPKSTIHRIINQYIDTGSTDYKRMGGDHRSIFKEEHKQAIFDIVDSNPAITLKELQHEIVDRFEDIPSVSIVTLSNYLNKEVRLTLKRLTPTEEKRNDPDTLIKRKEFVLSLQPEGILYTQNCIFIDEAGFNINMIKGRARSKAGESVFVETGTKRPNNFTVLFALSKRGVESCQVKLVSGGTTGKDFMQFVQQLVENLDAHGAEPYHLVMDNTRIHCNPGLREWLDKRNKHKSKFLPPYSPFLNPVEECFSKLKSFVKKHPLDDHESLVSRIQEGCKTITAENCEEWINHSISFFDKCLEMQQNL